MLYLCYCDSGRKHMFCENDTHGLKVCHVEFLRSQPLGTNESLIIGIVKNTSKLTHILSLLQCWKTTDTKTGWWLGKSQDFVVTSSVWRKQSTLKKEYQHSCYSCDYNTSFNPWECGVSYIRTTMFMLTRVSTKISPHIWNKCSKKQTLLKLHTTTLVTTLLHGTKNVLQEG